MGVAGALGGAGRAVGAADLPHPLLPREPAVARRKGPRGRGAAHPRVLPRPGRRERRARALRV